MLGDIIEKNTKYFYKRQTLIPTLEAGESLIKVMYCGVCGSDLHIFHGEHATAQFPIIPGHEFVGTLVETCGAPHPKCKINDLVVAQLFLQKLQALP